MHEELTLAESFGREFLCSGKHSEFCFFGFLKSSNVKAVISNRLNARDFSSIASSIKVNFCYQKKALGFLNLSLYFSGGSK